jgi:hypothetical protein
MAALAGAIDTDVEAIATDVATGGYRFLETVAFTATDTFDKADYTGLRAVIVEVQAPGGGSAGCPLTGGGAASGGAGGGAGGYSRKFVLASALSASETVTIGAPGAAGAAGAPPTSGGAGGTTSFGAHCQATGGAGGAASPASSGNSTATPGDGGVGSGGDLNVDGDDGYEIRIVGGVVVSSAAGARSMMAGRNRPSVSSVGGGASVGNDFGGGATGPHNNASQSARDGAAGGAGIVLVHVYV